MLGRRLSKAWLSFLRLVLVVVDGLDGKADAALHLVHLDDAGFDFVADLEHVLDLGHVVFAELADVHEAVDVVLELHEGAEAGDLRDLALDEVADLEAVVDLGSMDRRRAASCRG